MCTSHHQRGAKTKEGEMRNKNEKEKTESAYKDSSNRREKTEGVNLNTLSRRRNRCSCSGLRRFYGFSFNKKVAQDIDSMVV